MPEKKAAAKPKVDTAKVSSPLLASDPKFPPIGTRFESLKGCGALIIPWAHELGLKAETEEEAVLGMLHYEYGTEAFNAWMNR